MIPPSYTSGLAHEVKCVEIERDMLRRDNQDLRRKLAQARQDLGEFGRDINARCKYIADLEKEIDRLNALRPGPSRMYGIEGAG